MAHHSAIPYSGSLGKVELSIREARSDSQKSPGTQSIHVIGKDIEYYAAQVSAATIDQLEELWVTIPAFFPRLQASYPIPLHIRTIMTRILGTPMVRKGPSDESQSRLADDRPRPLNCLSQPYQSMFKTFRMVARRALEVFTPVARRAPTGDLSAFDLPYPLGESTDRTYEALRFLADPRKTTDEALFKAVVTFVLYRCYGAAKTVGTPRAMGERSSTTEPPWLTLFDGFSLWSSKETQFLQACSQIHRQLVGLVVAQPAANPARTATNTRNLRAAYRTLVREFTHLICPIVQLIQTVGKIDQLRDL